MELSLGSGAPNQEGPSLYFGRQRVAWIQRRTIGRRGRKRDFRDAERLLKRLVSQERTLSLVPNAEQRLWRTVTRTKYQLEALAGRSPYQVIQFGFGSARRKCTADAAGLGGGRN